MGGVCSRGGGEKAEEGEGLRELGWANVTSLEVWHICHCPLIQVCWAPTMFKDVHTSHYVLFYEMSVFLEPKEILDLAKQVWPFPGNYMEWPHLDVSVAKKVSLGKTLLASREGSSPWIDSTVPKVGGRRWRVLRWSLSTLIPGHCMQTSQRVQFHQGSGDNVVWVWLIKEMLEWKDVYFSSIIGCG